MKDFCDNIKSHWKHILIVIFLIFDIFMIGRMIYISIPREVDDTIVVKQPMNDSININSDDEISVDF